MVTPSENEQGYRVSILLYYDRDYSVESDNYNWLLGFISVVSSQSPV